MAEPPLVLLCCEAGAGQGHALALAGVARGLGPSFRYRAVLPRMQHAGLLEALCERVEQGPRLDRLSNPPPAGGLSWARWLLVRGFADPDILRARFEGWCRTLQAHRPALVVADFAPTVLMAARALGLRSVAIGGVFFLPPADMPRYPELLTRDEALLNGPVAEDGPPPDEAAMCAVIERTLCPLGLPPLGSLPQVHVADLSIARGLQLCDPYAPWRDHPPILAPARMPPPSDGSGTELFIYFSTAELQEPAICEALLRLPLPARLVAPGLSPDLANYLSGNPNLIIEQRPVPQEEIVARSRAILCGGQLGTLSLGLLAGIPLVALPVQHEQLFNSLRASERFASCRFVPRARRTALAILYQLDNLFRNPAAPVSARAAAMELRPQYDPTAAESYRRLIAPLLS